MDIVLEAFDTFFFDRLYATVLPSSGANSVLNSYNGNSSFLSEPMAGYHYKPASSYLSFEPSEWAYRSQWQRDNVWRQTTSLFLITWYTPPYLDSSPNKHLPS